MAIFDIIQANPRTAIISIALGVTLVLTLVRYFMTDREKMKSIRARQKALREEMKKFKDNPEKMMELNKRSLEDAMEQIRHSFKPMLITLIPLLLLFGWLRGTFATTLIASTWLWWYIGSSLVFSIILNKLFGLQ